MAWTYFFFSIFETSLRQIKRADWMAHLSRKRQPDICSTRQERVHRRTLFIASAGPGGALDGGGGIIELFVCFAPSRRGICAFEAWPIAET
jgi:hypothetical protein